MRKKARDKNKKFSAAEAPTGGLLVTASYQLSKFVFSVASLKKRVLHELLNFLVSECSMQTGPSMLANPNITAMNGWLSVTSCSIYSIPVLVLKLSSIVTVYSS